MSTHTVNDSRPSDESDQSAASPPVVRSPTEEQQDEDAKLDPKEVAWMLAEAAASAAITVAVLQSHPPENVSYGDMMLGVFVAAMLVINGIRCTISNHVKLKFSSFPITRLACVAWVGVLVFLLQAGTAMGMWMTAIGPFIILVAMAVATGAIVLMHRAMCKTLRREVADMIAYNEKVRRAVLAAAGDDTDRASCPQQASAGASEEQIALPTLSHKDFSEGKIPDRDE